MTFSYKHIGLLTGIILIFISFLFFGRQQGTYNILLISGLALALICYLVILFGKEGKILWTIIVILFAIIEQLGEPLIIESSYRIFINQHKSTLTEINDILQHRKGSILIVKDSVVVSKRDTLSKLEELKLKEGCAKLGTYMISRSDKRVYYGMWSYHSFSEGITYFQEKPRSDNEYRHLTGNWFH